MNIQSQKTLNTEASPGVIANTTGTTQAAEDATLMEEFSAVLDEIASHVRGNKGVTAETDSLNYLIAEQALLAARAPVPPQPEAPEQVETRDEQSEQQADGGNEQQPESEAEATARSAVQTNRQSKEEEVVSSERSLVPATTAAAATVAQGEPEVVAEDGEVAKVQVVASEVMAEAAMVAEEVPSDEVVESALAPAPVASGEHSVAKAKMNSAKAEASSASEVSEPVVAATPVAAPAEAVQPLNPASMTETSDASAAAAPILQALYAETSAAIATAANQAIQSLTAQVRSAFGSVDGAAAAGREGVKALTATQAQQANRADNSALAARAVDAGNRAERSAGSVKAVTRPQAHNIVEKVQKVLETAAQARDGKTISVQLEPGTLGKVKVDVSLREGSLHARLSAESADVGAVLREHAQELQSLLRRLGIDADKVIVSVVSEGTVVHHQSELSAHTDAKQQFSQSQKQGQSNQSQLGGEITNAVGTAMGSAVVGNGIDHWVA